MKTTEEWLRVFQQTECVLGKREIFKAFVAQIQLDAVKDGMVRAIGIINQRAELLEKNNAKDLIREHYHQQEIVIAAAKLTEKDL